MKYNIQVLPILKLLIFINLAKNVKGLSNGTKTKQGEFPYVVQLHTSKGRDPVCSGVIIHPDWILTSASCCVIGRHPIEDPRLINVLAYQEHLYPYKKGIFQMQRGSKLVVHPKYSFRNNSNNLCLLQVEEPFIFSNFVRAAELDINGWKWTDDYLERDCSVVGWGATAHFNVVPESTYESAPARYGGKACACGDENVPTDVSKNLICLPSLKSGFINENKFFCYTDFGRALICNNQLVGIYGQAVFEVKSRCYYAGDTCRATVAFGGYVYLCPQISWLLEHIPDLFDSSETEIDCSGEKYWTETPEEEIANTTVTGDGSRSTGHKPTKNPSGPTTVHSPTDSTDSTDSRNTTTPPRSRPTKSNAETNHEIALLIFLTALILS